MDIHVYFKKEKQELWFNLIAGGLLLVAGLLMGLLGGTFVNQKVIIGLALIPLAIGLGIAVRLKLNQKDPAQLKAVVASLTDERLVAQRNEAEATANRWLRWLTRLVFLGYTFALPQEIFTSAGWWVTFVLFTLSYLLPVTLLAWNSRGANEQSL